VNAALRQLSPASPRDAEAIRRLLAQNALPRDDIDAHLGDFIVAKVGDEIVGVAGLEIAGDAALLRSVAVRDDFRGSGMGRLLCERALARAKQRGATAIYLLTTTAADFFKQKLDFTALDRSAAPKAIQQTYEFREACPASACLLARKL
jgi:N-acetylglutamate synthase-like GNAT family acetyltransferase